MALVGTPNTNQAPAQGTPVPEKDNAEFKAAKKAAAQRHAAKVKEERQKNHTWFLKHRDWLKANNVFDKLSKEDQEYVLANCVPPTERTGHSGPSFFTELFTDKPFVGQSITLKEIITKTYKGLDTVNAQIKKWALKGIVVESKLNSTDMLSSTFTIKALGAKESA